MATCMAEALIKCQAYKRAKKENAQGVKTVKLDPEEKTRQKEERRMRSERKNSGKLQKYLQKELPG
jgi:hypothetical protein